MKYNDEYELIPKLSTGKELKLKVRIKTISKKFIMYGHLTPYRKGENAKQTCPRCWGDGVCPSWSGEGWPPACEGCGGKGVVSKKQHDTIVAEGFYTL